MKARKIVLKLLSAALLSSFVLLPYAGAQSKPLSKDDVMRLLKGTVSSERVEELAKENGINFALTPETEAALRDAGATNALLSTLRGLTPKSAPTTPPSKPNPPTETREQRANVETIEATATSGHGGQSNLVTLVIDHYSTREDAMILVEEFQKGQTLGLTNALKAMKAVGHISIEGARGPDVTYVFMVHTPKGRRIRFVTNGMTRLGAYDGSLSGGELDFGDQDESKSAGVLYPTVQVGIDEEGELALNAVGNPWELGKITDRGRAPLKDAAGIETVTANAWGTSNLLGAKIGVTLNVYQYSTPEEGSILAEAFRKGSNQGLLNALRRMKAVGRLKLTGTLGFDVSYITMIATPTGRKIRFVTNRQLVFGEAYSDSTSQSQNVTAGEIDLNDQDMSRSTGVLYPATQVGIESDGQLSIKLVANAWRLSTVTDWK